MKILYLWLFIGVTASIFWSCSNNSSNSQSEDYYVEEVTVLDSTVCEEVVVVDVDGMAECASDSAIDKSGNTKPQQPEKTYKSKSSPSHVSESTSSESAASLRKQFEALTDERYEIFKGLCEEYGIIGLFYIGSNNKLNIMVSDPGKDTRSEDELMYIAKGISEVVRTSVYQDKGFGGEDSELLHKVNPTFKVSIIGEDLKNETIELKLEETYN